MSDTSRTDGGEDATPRWSRTDVQRVLYHVVRCYEQANAVDYDAACGSERKRRRTPRRFVVFGRRLPFLGGDSELLRDAIRIGRNTLMDNDWWPSNDNDGQGASDAST